MNKSPCEAEAPAHRINRLTMLHGILIGAAALAGCTPEPLSEQFKGSWLNPTPDVMRILARNGVSGCGEFYQKPNKIRSEIVVACTDDGVSWRGHLVLMATENVIGPDDTLVNQVGGPPTP